MDHQLINAALSLDETLAERLSKQEVKPEIKKDIAMVTKVAIGVDANGETEYLELYTVGGFHHG